MLEATQRVHRKVLAIFFWIMHPNSTLALQSTNNTFHLLFSFELCILDAADATAAIDDVSLLFSFELCAGDPFVAWAEAKVLLFSFELCLASVAARSTLWASPSRLAIFFWIMQVVSYIRHPSTVEVSCYFLLNYAGCEEEGANPDTQADPCYFLLNYAFIQELANKTYNSLVQVWLAIFFWIMLDSFTNFMQTYSQIYATCYFLLNYACLSSTS